MGVGGSAPRPGRFTPTGERPGTHFIGGWVGPPGPVLTGAENLSPSPGFDPRTVQPVASLYADWAIPAAIGNTWLAQINY
jgi:hypothetical protein